MSDDIRDLDDVEAQAWAMAFASGVRWAESYPGRPKLFADECVRLLRERRGPVSAASVVSLATRLAAACGREADAVAVERTKIAAWLRAAADRVEVLPPERGEIGDKWKHADAVAGHLRITACAIERGEHDR